MRVLILPSVTVGDIVLLRGLIVVGSAVVCVNAYSYIGGLLLRYAIPGIARAKGLLNIY